MAVFHDGIIENYDEFKAKLVEAGHKFESDTDTEVVPHLIEDALADGMDREEAFRSAVARLEGSYALASVLARATTDWQTFTAGLNNPILKSDRNYRVEGLAVRYFDWTCYL